jgi:hypothetical protein
MTDILATMTATEYRAVLATIHQEGYGGQTDQSHAEEKRANERAEEILVDLRHPQ